MPSRTERTGAARRAAKPASRLPSMYQIGLMILDDQCPPDGNYYMCRMGCVGEMDDICADCWRHYMHYVLSRGETDPYRADRMRDDI